MATPSPDQIQRHHPELLTHVKDVVRALERFNDSIEPRSTSLMAVGDGRRRHRFEVFAYGFLSNVDEHEELVRRLRRLPARERTLLLLWYSEAWPVTAIADHLRVSRVHCYRLRDRALAALVVADPRAQTSNASSPTPPSPAALPSSANVDE